MSQIMTQSLIQAIFLALVLLCHNSDSARILTITAKSYITDLYVDGILETNLINDDRWNMTDDVNLPTQSRLIAIASTDTSFSCAGILASVTGDFLVTDASWKCSAQNAAGWYALGFDDSIWNAAYVIGRNGEVTAPSQCNFLPRIPSISSNASWIWTASIANAPDYDPIVFCRGYLPICDRESPCLNGGTCNKNDPQLCTCPPWASGTYCETEVSAQTTVAYPLEATTAAEPSRILEITAKSSISELYVDDVRKVLVYENVWNRSDDVDLTPDNRLIAVLAIDTSFTCAGVLASVTGDYLVTDASWKCTTQNIPQWHALGFNDSSWSAAYVIGKNGNVTTPSQCNILKEIPSISSNAYWIWTGSISGAPVYDPIVFCRGYLPTCERESPCLNGGTCNRNDPKLCTCPSGISGTYCDISYPFNAAVLVGETVIMKCQRTKPHISWWLTRPGFTTPTLVASDCTVQGNLSNLFAVDKTGGACNLVINNARIGHAGTYVCEDTTIDDERTSAQLTVLNGVQQCYSSVSPVVYGQTVTITCQLPYLGNWAPSIRWTDLYGEPVTNETTDTTSSSVTSSIVIPAYFPTVPAFTTAVFFNASGLPDVTDDVEADNTPTDIYYVPTQEMDVVCPDGFTRTSQYHCYQLVFENLDWFGARNRCQQLLPGAYLAVISNESEQSDIYFYLAQFPNTTKIWTSGHTTSCPNFAWEPLAGNFLPMAYTNWVPGEPSCTDGSEACTELVYPDYHWNDSSCLTSQPILCEFELTIK